MVVAKTGVATRVNKIESHAHLTIKIMRGTLDRAFKLSKLSNTLWFKNHRKKIKYSLKREAAFNRLREEKLRKLPPIFFIKQLTWLSTVFVIGFSRKTTFSIEKLL